jgi:hypothetical protein
MILTTFLSNLFKPVLYYLAQHRRENPSWVFYGLFACFLGVSLWWHYGTDYAMAYLLSDWMPRFWVGALFYAVPYFFTVGLYSVCYQKTDFWLRTSFWLLSVGILFVLTMNQFSGYYLEIVSLLPIELQEWGIKLGFNLNASFFYLLIPAVFWCFSPTLRRMHFYGCTTRDFKWQTYALMLVVMLPLLIWASFRVDFLHTYPRYLPNTAAERFISPVWTVVLYELTYIVQFIALEIFFRGFIVMALAQYLGSASVFPMVAVYAFLHFFKPMPETLGSIFGGYILGSIAFYSRSVYGGMWVHIGIALLMELLAAWQLWRIGA